MRKNGYDPLPLDADRAVSGSAREHRLVTNLEREPVEEAAQDLDIPMPVPLGVAPQDSGAVWTGVDVVQFTSAMYFVNEDEGSIAIDVMRIGSLQGSVKVRYSTEDGSAKAGSKYVETSGELIFKSGEFNQSLTLHMVEDPAWGATLDFKVHLEAIDGCEVGLYLKSCRIKIINVDYFPSNKYEDFVARWKDPDITNVPDDAPAFGLFWEYIKLVFHSEGMRWRTILVLFLDQMRNLYLLQTLYVNVYLVNVVLDVKNPASVNELFGHTRKEIALIICAMYIFPVWVIHFWDYSKVNLAVAGKARAYVQTNFFRNYMNYSDRARREVRGISVAILKDCPEVGEGYVMVLNLLQKLVGLLIMQGFMLTHSKAEARYVVVAMPVLMSMYGIHELRHVDAVTKVRMDKLFDSEQVVDEVEDKYEVIADYGQRNQINIEFTELIGSLNKALAAEAKVILNYMICPQHLCAIFTGGWIAWKVPDVIDGTESLGTFLAMLTVFGKVASDFGIVYADLLDLKKRTVVLQGLSRFFNMETETSDLKVLSRKRRALTHQSRRSLTYQSEAPRLLESPKKGASKIKCPLTDMMLLEMRSVTLQYEPAPPLILRAKAAAYQGTLVCISSCGSGAGRQSLMRALAYKKFPSIGMISIPSHLRVVHVSSEPCILDRSAWGNLTFACSTEDPSRVLDICHQLEMSFTQQVLKKDLERMGMLTPELCRKCDVNKVAADSLLDHEDGTKWQHRLTDSEIAKIHLARAFVMNPEVLVLQRPFRRFSEGQGERRRLMDAIRNHINHRGLGLDPKTAGRRRPRTVFFTAEAKSQEEEADVVWTIMEDKSIAMRLGGQSTSSSKKPVSNGVLDAMSLSSGTSGTSSVSALFWPCRVAAKATVEKDT